MSQAFPSLIPSPAPKERRRERERIGGKREKEIKRMNGSEKKGRRGMEVGMGISTIKAKNRKIKRKKK